MLVVVCYSCSKSARQLSKAHKAVWQLFKAPIKFDSPGPLIYERKSGLCAPLEVFQCNIVTLPRLVFNCLLIRQDPCASKASFCSLESTQLESMQPGRQQI
eukprot:GHVN01058683.1.p1 GENE.GHVN01058683.1~~GHVN01058683.1.p1  ORF type:complete len:101 (+),score=0.89 GHVN01058683.1:1282-1584(+)